MHKLVLKEEKAFYIACKIVLVLSPIQKKNYFNRSDFIRMQLSLLFACTYVFFPVDGQFNADVWDSLLESNLE